MDLLELRKMVEAKEAEARELQKLEEERRNNASLVEQRSRIHNLNLKDNYMSEEIRNNIMKQFVETRADEGLKINSTGKDYYGELVEKFRMDKPLSSRASFLRAAAVGFQIPIISARPAVNVSSTEGDTGLSVDSQMAIGRKTLTPSLYYSILGITYQTEKLSQITDNEIEDAFAESFGEAIETAMQSRNAGSSYPISGLLSADTSVCASGNAITAATASKCTWADMLALAEKAVGKSGNWNLVVPAGVISGLIAEETDDYSFMKEELLRNGTIRGVKVVEIAAPVVHTAGSVYATLIDLQKNYKVAIAAEDIILRRVYDKNSLNSYLQGAVGMAAGVVLNSEVFQLVSHSWLDSVTSGGSWTNDQVTGEDVDPTGLTFTVTYTSGDTKDVTSDVTWTPEKWGSTSGTQKATFSYSEAGETVSVEVEATVVEPVEPEP